MAREIAGKIEKAQTALRIFLQEKQMTDNPYAAPKANLEPTTNEDETIRKAHLNTEASIQGVGSLYVFSGMLTLVRGLAALVGLGEKFPDPLNGDGLAVVLLGPLVLGVFFLAGGIGLRKLKRWSRIVATLGSALGLLIFPIGTLISAYILYLLWGKQGRMVFSSDYRNVIAATPHIKYKTSIIVWIVFGLLVLVIAAASVSPMLAGK